MNHRNVYKVIAKFYVIIVIVDALVFDDCGGVAFISYVKSSDTSFYTSLNTIL